MPISFPNDACTSLYLSEQQKKKEKSLFDEIDDT